MIENNNEQLHYSLKDNCHTCPSAHLCIPGKLPEEDTEVFSSFARKKKILQPGEYLCRAGDKVVNLFALRSGTCKVYEISAGGNEKVTGFCFPGDLVALESIPYEKHNFSVVALSTVCICVLPLKALLALADKKPTLLHRLLTLASYKMHNDSCTHLSDSAEQRLAAFLLNLSLRYQRRYCSPTKINLPMSRGDIASMLGLAAETISRLLKNFEHKEVIAVSRGHIDIVDLQKLKQIAA